MPFTPTVWVTGDIITAAKANNWETQYGYGSSELTTHKATTDIDHPAGSVGDTAIGNRTVTDGSTATGNTGALTDFLSWLANKAKAMQGSTAWTDAPGSNLAAVAAHIGAGGTAHPDATTSAAGFISPLNLAQIAGGEVYDTAFGITGALNNVSTGVLVGAVGSTCLGRYDVATKALTQHTHGSTPSIRAVTEDSTYIYGLQQSTAGDGSLGIRRIHMVSSSATNLTTLVRTDEPNDCNNIIGAGYNGGDYIYTMVTWIDQATTPPLFVLGLHRYSIAGNAWTTCYVPFTGTSVEPTSGTLAIGSDGVVRYSFISGTTRCVYGWDEPSSSSLGNLTLRMGSSGHTANYVFASADHVLYAGLANAAASSVDEMVASQNAQSSGWRIHVVPALIEGVLPRLRAFDAGWYYWVDGNQVLYRWPIA